MSTEITGTLQSAETLTGNLGAIDLVTGAVILSVPGPKGDKGDTGANGTDASVTSANIATALGYTPADAAHLGTAASQNSTAFDVAGAASTALSTATTRAIAFAIGL